MSAESYEGVEVKKASPLANLFPILVIVVGLIISFTVFYTRFAAPENFQNGVELKNELEAYEEGYSKWKAENKDIIAQYDKEYGEWEKKYKAWEEEKLAWQKANPTWKKDQEAWNKEKEASEELAAKWKSDSTKWSKVDSVVKATEAAKAAETDLPQYNIPRPPAFDKPEPVFSKEEPTMSMEEPKYALEEPKHWTEMDPKPGNYFGIIYKGGPIIPVAFTLLIMVIAFSIERFISLARARGKGSIDVFVKKIRMALEKGDIDGAISECDKQRGSVANVVKAGLKKYKEVENEQNMDKDQKKLAIQTELEEATTLELPMLEKNLPIIATIVGIGVLVGLFGTVLGMIRAFAALSTSGAPDTSALATGISEALVNTALGIFNSLIAMIAYNFFTSQIDSLTYNIDEAGYSIIQTFDLRHK